MKERFFNNVAIEQLSNVLPLTTPAKNIHTRSEPRFNRGGEILMEGKEIPIKKQKPPESPKPTSSSSKEDLIVSPFIKSAKEILEPSLRAYATVFEEKIAKNPLGNWKEEELKKEYLELHKLTSQSEGNATDSTIKEKISAETQPYRNAIIEEYERKGGDPIKLFLEALKYAGETGKTVSVGATAGMPEMIFPDVDRFDRRLQPIARLVDSRIAVNRADIDFIEEQLRKIGNITIEPGISDEVIIQGGEIVDRLYQVRDELARERNLILEERERYGAFGDRRLSRGEKALIKSVALGRDLTPEEMLLLRQERTLREEELLSPEGRRYAVDRIFNRVFDNVDANPKIAFQEAFQIANYEYMEFMRILNEARGETNDAQLSQQILRSMRQYSEERKLREAAHNVNYVVVSDREIDDLINFVKGFQAEQADLAFSKRGVTEALHFYEQALLKVREENNGYIPAYAVVGEAKSEFIEGSIGRVEDLTKRYLLNAARIGLLPQMADWEITRAISLARGMGIITGRTMEIAATSVIPGEGIEASAPRIGSVYAQKIITGMAPFRHLIYKFNILHEANRVFGYLLNKKKAPWNKSELERVDLPTMLNIINGLAPDEEDRFFGILNPFEVGGAFSRTSWRIHGNTVNSAISDLLIKGRVEFKRKHNIADNVDLSQRRTGIDYEKFLTADERRKGKKASLDTIEAINAFLETNPGSDFAEGDQKRIDAVKDELNIYSNWIGTGMQLERLRGGLLSDEKRAQLEEAILQAADSQVKESRRKNLKDAIDGDEEAEKEIRKILQKIARIQPLKLFYNLKRAPSFQAEVLREYYGKADIDSELREDLDYLVVIQEKAIKDALESPDKQEVPLTITSETAGDAARAQRLNRFANIVRTKFIEEKNGAQLNKFIDDLRDREWKVPFNFGTEDAPFEEYSFAKTGSDTFGRRWGDIGDANKAGQAMLELMDGIPSFRNPEQIVQAMKKIYNHVSSYDGDIARNVIAKLTKSIIRYYSKDWFARLPAGIGSLVQLTGKTSFAELMHGKGAMSWDEIQINEFTRLVQTSGMMTVEGQHGVQREVGGGRSQVGLAYARTVLPIILIALMYYTLSKTISEKS